MMNKIAVFVLIFSISSSLFAESECSSTVEAQIRNIPEVKEKLNNYVKDFISANELATAKENESLETMVKIQRQWKNYEEKIAAIVKETCN